MCKRRAPFVVFFFPSSFFRLGSSCSLLSSYVVFSFHFVSSAKSATHSLFFFFSFFPIILLPYCFFVFSYILLRCLFFILYRLQKAPGILCSPFSPFLPSLLFSVLLPLILFYSSTLPFLFFPIFLLPALLPRLLFLSFCVSFSPFCILSSFRA